jgi:hypothetical protein
MVVNQSEVLFFEQIRAHLLKFQLDDLVLLFLDARATSIMMEA